ncbi:hypothetical protein M0R45_002592 [Rubus argutus]|uniref:Rhamnogalacturonase A/B/Epimerase-like pectate lyase domain-containing protein n=1 Tax=Rubus argutus TaxID=59490 RepID=A0AAW1VNM4_RUBAR
MATALPLPLLIQSLTVTVVFFPILLTLLQSISATSSATTTIELPHHLSRLSVTDFGATGDGVTYDTCAIQSAIDSCCAAPCYVTFPRGGTYLTATIRLKSGVVLDIEEGATLLGGPRLQDYPTEQRRWYVVLAENASDVGDHRRRSRRRSGLGVREEIRSKEERDGQLELDRRLSRRRPAYWCLHIVRCESITIQDVSIYGDFNTPNNDGIDIEDSNNTVITRCHIDTGDDAICPKTSTGPLYNLTVTNCWIRTKSSAIKLGSASWFDFKGLVFDNITISDSHRGLGFQIRDGGNVSDVIFSNINISTRYYHQSWWGRAEPIYVTTCPRDSYSKEGSISNLLFVNITANSENGVFLSGSKGALLSDLRFINLNLTYRRRTNNAGGLADYRPGCQGLVNHSTAGFILENINGLVFENVYMRWSDDQLTQWNNPLDFRSSTVNNISLLNFRSSLYTVKEGDMGLGILPFF